MNETPTDRRKIDFTYYNWIHHVQCVFVHHWVTLVVTYFVILGVVWGVIQTVEELFDVEAKGTGLAIAYFAGCLPFALIGAWLKYYFHVPDVFKNEPREAIRLVHLRPKHWESSLAIVLYQQHISPLEEEYNRLIRGEAYVPTTSCSNVNDYLDLIETRLSKIRTLLNAFSGAVIATAMNVFDCTDGNSIDPSSIQKSIKRLAEYYQGAIDIEREHLGITPPMKCEYLHKISTGWTSPLVKGASDILSVYREINKIDVRRTDNLLQRTIVIEGPSNIDEASAEMDRIAQRYIDIN